MRQYKVADAAQAVLDFWWDQLCDVYVELSKPFFAGEPVTGTDETRLVLLLCVDQAVRMISVFMPFLCEEVFQRLPRYADELQLRSVMQARLPRDCGAFDFGNIK